VPNLLDLKPDERLARIAQYRADMEQLDTLLKQYGESSPLTAILRRVERTVYAFGDALDEAEKRLAGHKAALDNAKATRDLPPGAPLLLALAPQASAPSERVDTELAELEESMRAARARLRRLRCEVATKLRVSEARIETDMGGLRRCASRIARAVLDHVEKEGSLVKAGIEEAVLEALVLCAASAGYSRAGREADEAHRAPNRRGTP
jgi:hypothetical protein